MKTRLFLNSLVIATATTVSGNAWGDVLAYDGFETVAGGTGTAYEADASIVGQSDARTGFTGAWTNTGGALADTVNFDARTAGLTYTGYTPNAAGSVEAFRTSGGATAKEITRSMSYASPGTDDFYISFLLSYAGTADSDSILTLLGADNRDSFFRLDHSTGNLTADLAGGTGLEYTEALTSSANLIVVRAVYDSDGSAPGSNPTTDFYDYVELWINPTIVGGDLGTPDATGYGIMRSFNGGANPLAYSGLSLTHDLETGGSFFADEFLISDSTSNFVIPEPASLALMGLGGLLMLGRSRQR